MTAATTAPNGFASCLYDTLARTQAGQGIFLSPFSIQVTLAMCAAGARGETRRALAELIGAPAGHAEQNHQYAELLRSINMAGGRDVQLATANALWVQKGDRLQPDYQKAVADFYEGACNELDFRALPDQAVQAINAWVESKTAGKIRDLISRQMIDFDTRLILTNAIYFKGKWANEFDKSHTWDEDWHGAKGTRKVPMMHQTRGQSYYECADFQALDLPYQGEQLSLLIVLPTKPDGLATLESKWTADVYQQVTSALAHEESVIVSLPRFKMESQFQLKSALCDLGAAPAFSAGADFGGIATGSLNISEVIHKAFIEVNEEGTEAAAATGVVAKRGFVSDPKVFQADHPFLFAIRERKTGLALFLGRLLEP